jgi:hypothetical protein
MWRKISKKVDHIDCKIKPFEVKNWAFFAPFKAASTIFESSWLKTLVLHKVKVFNTMWAIWV